MNFRRSINIDVKTKLPKGLYIGCSQKKSLNKATLISSLTKTNTFEQNISQPILHHQNTNLFIFNSFLKSCCILF